MSESIIISQCPWCHKSFSKKQSSNRVYCPNHTCRREARASGIVVRRPVAKKRVFTEEQVKRWDEVMSTAQGCARWLHFLARNEGR